MNNSKRHQSLAGRNGGAVRVPKGFARMSAAKRSKISKAGGKARAGQAQRRKDGKFK